MNEAEIILISGRYGVRSDSQKLAEGLAILWLLQQLDQKMPKLHLQDRHSIAIAIWIGKSKKDWKFKNQPSAGSPEKSRKSWQTGGNLGVSGELPLTRCECITLAYLAIREEARM